MSMYLARIKLWAAAAGTAAVAILLAYWRGAAAGKRAEQARTTREILDKAEEANDVENEVRGMGDVELRSRASKWVRDD